MHFSFKSDRRKDKNYKQKYIFILSFICTFIFTSTGATQFFICIFLGKMFSTLGQVLKTLFQVGSFQDYQTSQIMTILWG